MDPISTINRRTLLGAAAAITTATTIGSPAVAQVAAPDLKGRSILITGSSSGFGYAGALHYARAGAKVIASMRNLPRAEADKLKATSQKENLDITIIEMDVTSDEQVANGVAEAQRIAGGALDALINNAGIGLTGPVEMQDIAATQLMFDTNVYGCHRVARAVLPAMRKAKRGQIFNISSQLGRVILPGGGHYSATKFALEAMSEQMAYELAPHGVEVTIIQPGGYPTDVWRNRNRYTGELLARADEERKAAYAMFTSRMGTEDGSGRSADIFDVPRAIAEIIAMPAGSRPLRQMVHPVAKPQEAINKVSAETQRAWLGNSPYGPLIKAVHD
ncbi:SDR family oxidoreductase [Sphingorhabdus sp. EL138]|uniref:SDR family oxidoreductase n=1 Tax=Sphingorhabdus sp. EL138 TaxID=2073156 RepID=UPI003419A755